MMRTHFLIILLLALVQTLPGQFKQTDYLTGRAWIARGSYDSALHYLDKAVEEHPKDMEARYYRGMVHFRMNSFPQASKDFLMVNKQDPGRSALMLSKTEIRLNRKNLAIKYLREHLGSPYKLPRKDILLDPELSELEDYPGWKQIWSENKWYSESENKLQEAVYLMNSGEAPEAMNRLSQLEKERFHTSTVRYYKAKIYFESGNTKSALNEVNAALRADSRNKAALKLRIMISLENEDFEQVVTDCATLLRQDAGLFDYYLVSGTAKGKLGRYEQALNDFNLYIRLFPGDHSAYYKKGKMQKELGKYLDALLTMNTTLELSAGQAEYFSLRGEIYAGINMHRYALKDYSMALDLDPRSAMTWFLKGLSDLESGAPDSACYDFRMAVKYGSYEAQEYMYRYCDSP